MRAETLLETDLENASAALADARDDLADKDRLRRTAKEASTSARAAAFTAAIFWWRWWRRIS